MSYNLKCCSFYPNNFDASALPLEALIQIAQCLEVDIKELIRVPEHNPYKEL